MHREDFFIVGFVVSAGIEITKLKIYSIAYPCSASGKDADKITIFEVFIWKPGGTKPDIRIVAFVSKRFFLPGSAFSFCKSIH